MGSYKNPGRTYQVDMGRLHCECKRPEISGHPCAHIFAVGLKGGKDPYKYMNTADTMHGYRKQYCDAVRLSPPETGADEDASACPSFSSGSHLLALTSSESQAALPPDVTATACRCSETLRPTSSSSRCASIR